jgi:NADH-quinone oxidoreductase subunit G
MCSRCVRFTREISGTGELQIIARGSHAEIDIFPGEPCNNKLAGNVVDLCPVGALCSKDFLYKQRVWWLQGKNSVCPNCSTGCSIRVDQNDDVVYRLKPRTNPKAQGYFMCDEGRFGYKYIHSPERLKAPQVRQGDRTVSADWETVLPAVRAALEGAVTSRAAAVAAVISPWATVEEAYLLSSYLKALAPDVRLAMGPVRVLGEDDRYPKDVHGNPVEPATFVIHAEKCPNRRGVEEVLRHFQGEVIPSEHILAGIGSGEIDSLYLVGGDPAGWGFSEDQSAALSRLRLLIVQDILPSPASAAAHYVLAGGAFAEKDGTFINHAGLAQAIYRAIRDPDDARPDGRILWDLAGRRGLFHAANLRREIARTIPALQALIVGELGEYGVLLSETVPMPDAGHVPVGGKREITAVPTTQSPQR